MTSTPSRCKVLRGSVGALLTATLGACGRNDNTATTGAGPTRSPGAPGGTLGLGIVGLIVKDPPASPALYRRLGLAVPEDVDTSGGAVRFRLSNGHIFVWETAEYTQAGFDRG